MQKSNRHPLSLRSEAGFSLMQVLLLGGVVLATTGGTLQIMDTRAQSLKISRVSNRFALLEDRVKNAATSQNAMYVSASNAANADNAFKRCLFDRDCRDEVPSSYNLFSSFSDPVSGSFNANGERCKEVKDSPCPIKVETTATMKCTDGATTCLYPEAIVTTYTIAQDSGAAFTKGFKVKPRIGTVTLANRVCPEGEYVVGVDARGNLLCSEARRSAYGTKCERGAAFGITERGELRCAELIDFCNKSLALVSVIDTSGSMLDQNKLKHALDSAETFLDKLKADDEGGLVSFDSNARPNQSLDKNKGKAKGQLKNLVASGATNMTAGLIEANNLLQSAGKGPVKGIVFLSDGWHNVGDPPFATAESLKKDGINIWTIGFGDMADGATLMRLASSPDNYAFAKNAADLDKIYKNIATTMCRE